MYIIHPDPQLSLKLLNSFYGWEAFYSDENHAFNYKDTLIIPSIELEGKFICIVDSDYDIPPTETHLFINEADMMNWSIVIQRIGEFVRGKNKGRRSLNNGFKVALDENFTNNEHGGIRNKEKLGYSRKRL